MHDNNCPWSFLQYQKSEFCEEQLCSWVVQPGNTWTNIIYLIVGILILRTKNDHSKEERLIFGISTLLLFLGSGFFHMSGSHVGKMFDVSSMFLLSVAILSLSLQKTFLLKSNTTIAIFVIGFLISLYPLWFHDNGYVVFAAQIIIAVILEFRMLRSGTSSLDRSLLLSSIATLLIAFGIWILDRNKIVCDPDNHILPGHGVWHLLTGVSIYLFFKAKKAQT